MNHVLLVAMYLDFYLRVPIDTDITSGSRGTTEVIGSQAFYNSAQEEIRKRAWIN
jgi:hypothetical protein